MLGKPSGFLMLGCRLVFFCVCSGASTSSLSQLFHLSAQRWHRTCVPSTMGQHIQRAGASRKFCSGFPGAEWGWGGTQAAPHTYSYTAPSGGGPLGPLVGAVGGARAAGSRCPPIGVRVATATAPAAPAGPQRERVMSRARRRPVWAARG